MKFSRVPKPTLSKQNSALACLGLTAILFSTVATAQSADSNQSSSVLTLSEAVAAATANNRQIRKSTLDVQKSAEAVEGAKTSRYPQFNLYANSGLVLTPLTFTIPKGTLGTYPATGPLPNQDASITTHRDFSAIVYGSVSQPLTQLLKINLAVQQSRLGVQLSQEAERQQQIQTINQVKAAYYALVQTQSQLRSAEVNLKYLAQLATETERNIAQQTALKADGLNVKAKLAQQRYQMMTLRDSLDTQRETLNRLIGRNLSTTFSVEMQPAAQEEELDLSHARRIALDKRPEIRQARLQTKNAELDVRRQRAQYIPDVSLQFNYLSAPNIDFLPHNVASAGFLLQWQPFDWGQKRHKLNQLKLASQQASVSEEDAAQQILIDVGASFRKLQEARVLLETQTAVTEAEEEKLRVLINRYDQKAALLSDVLQQQSSLAQANTAQSQALAAFWTSKADFERALGGQ